MNTKKSFGFTLIELLVVMAIIGILSGVVLTSLNGARQKGRDARRISDIKQLQLALELYYDSKGYYPDTIGPAGPTSPLVDEGFIASIPTDPSTNTLYSYTPYASSLNLAVCTGYHIGASLESGITHTVLQNDADVATGGTLCTAGTPVDFDGADSDPCVGTDIGTACYDARS